MNVNFVILHATLAMVMKLMNVIHVIGIGYMLIIVQNNAHHIHLKINMTLIHVNQLLNLNSNKINQNIYAINMKKLMNFVINVTFKKVAKIMNIAF